MLKLLVTPLLLAICCLTQLEQTDKYVIANALECNEVEYDFSTVKASSIPLAHTFFLKNITQKDCYIKVICTSCSCMTVKYDRKMIQPGEIKEVTLIFNDADYSGKFDKTAIVYMSNIKNPFALRIKGNIFSKELDSPK